MPAFNGMDVTTSPRTTPPAPALSVAVVICAYSTQRWTQLCAAVDSVLGQTHPVNRTLIVIDHNETLYDWTRRRFGAHRRVTVLSNTHPRGLSGARNTGLRAAGTDVVAFLDDDASAEPSWCATMLRHYLDPDVAVVGGHAAPRWPANRPRWLPEEFDWVVGCSYRGQPTTVAPVRNPLGCNMSVRRELVADGFDPAVGRIGRTPTGCEETELCIRISQRTPNSRIIYDPGMRVHHHVSPERTTLRYFVRRCYHEGRSKAAMTRLIGVADALRSERAYTRSVLPAAVARALRKGQAALAAMVIAGLAVTAAGYAHGLLLAAFRGIRR